MIPRHSEPLDGVRYADEVPAAGEQIEEDWKRNIVIRFREAVVEVSPTKARECCDEIRDGFCFMERKQEITSVLLYQCAGLVPVRNVEDRIISTTPQREAERGHLDDLLSRG